jgi:hypothetical protein
MRGGIRIQWLTFCLGLECWASQAILDAYSRCQPYRAEIENENQPRIELDFQIGHLSSLRWQLSHKIDLLNGSVGNSFFLGLLLFVLKSKPPRVFFEVPFAFLL